MNPFTPTLMLATVSLLWAFSFGLVGNTLVGVPSPWVAALRLGLASLVLLPFFRYRALPKGWLAGVALLLIGALQFGCMYLFLFWSYRFLPSHLVALFTVFTPVYILILHQMSVRSWRVAWFGAALLSIVGALVIRWHSGIWETGLAGFMIVQAANLCFGAGQLGYRAWQRHYGFRSDRSIFALIYFGGFSVSLIFALGAVGVDPLTAITLEQWRVLGYLGVIASGLGFFLWNYAAARTEAAVLAVANNWIVPLGVVVSLAFFGEAAGFDAGDWVRLLFGCGFIYLAYRWAMKPAQPRV